MGATVGRLHRGLLKTLARVWNPQEIQDPAIQQKVLAHMQAAEPGLPSAEAARRRKLKAAAFGRILRCLRNLSSLGQLDNLSTAGDCSSP